MKLVILLICLISAASCSEILTSSSSTLWTFTYLTPAVNTTAYNFTLAYSTGATVSAAVITTAGNTVGVVCIITTSNFTVVDTASSSVGFGFEAVSTAGTALNDVAAAWNAITLWTHPAMTHTSEISLDTGAGSSNCAMTTVANVPTAASFVITYTNSVPSACANLQAMGVTWYGRCYHQGDSVKVASIAGSVTIAVSAAKNVTVGASTFATGATILAGIAYLQF
jgi:hypothetical protein